MPKGTPITIEGVGSFPSFAALMRHMDKAREDLIRETSYQAGYRAGVEAGYAKRCRKVLHASQQFKKGRELGTAMARNAALQEAIAWAKQHLPEFMRTRVAEGLTGLMAESSLSPVIAFPSAGAIPETPDPSEVKEQA